jgi:Uma2 family endonuclease
MARRGCYNRTPESAPWPSPSPSLSYDRRTKLRLYAEQGVPEYWIVDVVARRIEVHREPEAGTFQSTRIFERGESIALLHFPDVTIPVAEVMK